MAGERLGRRFVLLWSSSTLSNLGDGITVAALPLLAAALTREPAVFAAVTVASRLPWLLLSLPAGRVVDRFDRRRVVAWGNALRWLIMGALGAAVAADAATVLLLSAAAFAIGALETGVDVSAQALLPAVVTGGQLERANGRLISAGIVAGELAGPPVGAALYSMWAAAPPLADAAAFGLAALAAAAITGDYRPAAPAAARAGTAAGGAREGLRWLWRHPVLRGLALVGGTMNAAWMAGYAVLGLFALETLGLGGPGFGLLLACAAVGGVAGGAGADRLLARLPRGVALLGAAASHGFVFVTVGAAASTVVTALALVWMGFTAALWNVVAVSLRQVVVPDALLGRVGAAYRFVQWGLMPLGALAGGILAEHYGLAAPWLAGGAAVLAVTATLGTATLRTGRVEAARAAAPRA